MTDEETGNSSKFREYLFYGAVFVVWAVFNNKYGFIYFDRVSFWCVVVVFGYNFIKFVQYKFRYDSPQFIADGIAGSIADPPIKIGEFAVIGLDGVLDDMFHIKGRGRTVVVPHKSLMRIGMNWISNVQIKQTEFAALPDQVEGYIESEQYSKDKVYWGLARKGFKLDVASLFSKGFKDMDTAEFMNMMEKMEQRNEELKLMLKGKFDVVEDAAGHLGRVGAAAKKKTLFEQLGIKREPEEQPR